MGYLKKWPCHEFSHILSSEPVPVVSDLGISTLALSPKKAKQDPHHCFWHAADTPPLEGLLFWMFLACGWSAVVDMLHMLAYAQEVGWLITLLTTVRQGPRNLLPKALWRWCFERWEKRNGLASERLHLKNENHEVTVITNIFFKQSNIKIDSQRRRNTNCWSWVTRLPIEMDVHVANMFEQVPQIPALCFLASKISISNLSPLQGRRVKRLPCFSANHQHVKCSSGIYLAVLN